MRCKDKALSWKEKRRIELREQRDIKAHQKVFLDCGECVDEVI